MIVGLSTSEDLAIADQLAFAERRVRNFETVKIVTIDQTTPISIGSLPCYTTTAIGDGDETATSLFVAL